MLLFFHVGNEKVYINLAPIESLKIFGFTDSQHDIIQKKRKIRPFGNEKELEDTLGPDFKKLKADYLEKIVYFLK